MSGSGGNTIFLAPNGVTTFVFTDYGQDTYSLNCPSLAESIQPYPGEGIRIGLLVLKGVWLIPENLQKIRIANYLLLSWIALCAASWIYLLVHIARSEQSTLRSKWVWLIITLILGPLSLIAYWIFDRRSRHGLRYAPGHPGPRTSAISGRGLG